MNLSEGQRTNVTSDYWPLLELAENRAMEYRTKMRGRWLRCWMHPVDADQ